MTTRYYLLRRHKRIASKYIRITKRICSRHEDNKKDMLSACCIANFAHAALATILFYFFCLTFIFQLMDKLWSQVSSLLPSGRCLRFLSLYTIAAAN